MASAPLDPQSPARRLLLRALSLPLPLPRPLPLPSRTTPTPTPGFNELATIELDLLDPPHQQSQRQQWQQQQQQQQQSSLPQLRRRQTTIATLSSPTSDDNYDDHHILTSRLPWPVQTLGAQSPSRHRRSIESCFSDASSLSTLSESEPRRKPARPRVPKIKSREAESEAIWREHWI